MMMTRMHKPHHLYIALRDYLTRVALAGFGESNRLDWWALLWSALVFALYYTVLLQKKTLVVKERMLKWTMFSLKELLYKTY